MAFERKFLEQHFGISPNGLFSFQSVFLSASLSLSPGLVSVLHQPRRELVLPEQAAAKSSVDRVFFFLPFGKKI